MKSIFKKLVVLTALAVLCLVPTTVPNAAVVDISVGDGNAYVPMPGVFKICYTLDCSVNNLVTGNVLKLINLPAHSLLLGAFAHVTTADSVAAVTFDVGTYKQSDDSAIDADCLFNELAAGVDETKVCQLALANPGVLYNYYIGVCQGNAGGSSTFNDAVIEFTFIVADMRIPDGF